MAWLALLSLVAAGGVLVLLWPRGRSMSRRDAARFSIWEAQAEARRDIAARTRRAEEQIRRLTQFRERR